MADEIAERSDEPSPLVCGSCGKDLLTLENFADSFEAGLGVTPFAWVFYLGYMFLVVFTVLNVLIGIVLNAMDDARSESDESKELVELEKSVRKLEAANANGSIPPNLMKRISHLITIIWLLPPIRNLSLKKQ